MPLCPRFDDRAHNAGSPHRLSRGLYAATGARLPEGTPANAARHNAGLDTSVESLFSAPWARELFANTCGGAEPDTAAADFIAVLKGAVFDRFAGARAHLHAGTTDSAAQFTALLAAYLRGLIGAEHQT